MIGVSFGGCQAWYHPASSSRAVVMCQAHGFEDLCARKSMRVLAERIAETGCAVLRYDFPGCANSAGGDEDSALVAKWRASVKAAVEWLKAEAGAREIVVLGLRLGALIAALEAPGLADLKGIALLAPVTSGRQFVREMRLLAKIMRPPNAIVVADSAGPDANSVDVCGFQISSETQADLGSLSLSGVQSLGDAPVLIMRQNGTNVDTLAKVYNDGGDAVTITPFDGYEEMICDPTASKVPFADIETVIEWLEGLGCAPAAGTKTVSASALESTVGIERAITFGEGGRLAGIFSEPTDIDTRASPVIFLNGGMNYHIGWGRMHLRMARELAAKGIPSLRYDVTGVGDSLGPQASDELPLYRAEAEECLAAAIDWIEAHGHRAPLIVGGCSGAYTAFHMARKDRRIAGAVIVNLQCFSWTPALGLEVDRWRVIRRKEYVLDHRVQDNARTMARLIAGVSVFGLKALRAVGRIAKRIARARPAGDGSQVMTWFQELARRNVEIALVFSEGDPGLVSLEVETGPMGERLGAFANVALHIIEGADHNLTPRAAQDELYAIILEMAQSGANSVIEVAARPGSVAA